MPRLERLKSRGYSHAAKPKDCYPLYSMYPFPMTRLQSYNRSVSRQASREALLALLSALGAVKSLQPLRLLIIFTLIYVKLNIRNMA